MKNNVFKAKQEWLEAVMASDLNPATKVFAFGLFKRMYGDKTTSFPTEKALSEDTGLNRSKFKVHRDALVAKGWITAEQVTMGAGRKRYTYGLILLGTSNVPRGDVQMFPEGTLNVPRGDANTTNNTSIEDNNKDNNIKPSAVASGFGSKSREQRDVQPSPLVVEEPSSPLSSIEETGPSFVQDEEVSNVPTGNIQEEDPRAGMTLAEVKEYDLHLKHGVAADRAKELALAGAW